MSFYSSVPLFPLRNATHEALWWKGLFRKAGPFREQCC